MNFLDALQAEELAIVEQSLEMVHFSEGDCIIQAAGIQRDDAIRLLVVPLDESQVQGPFGKEKLAPILSLFTVDGEAEGFELCEQILRNEGIGHTAIIHTQDMELAKRFGLVMPVSRVLVNSPGSQGCIGLGNGLTPSLTLGCVPGAARLPRITSPTRIC